MAAEKFLLIENPGVASIEAFTLLGASNKAGSDAIGQFGSGTKFGILSLLRSGCSPIIYCGLLRLEFSTKKISFEGCGQEQVIVKISGKSPEGKQINRTQELSLVLRYGEIDWTDVRLACREFVSNAIDAVNDPKKVEISLEKLARAKDGVTRIYLPLEDSVRESVLNFYAELSKWFLHFGEFKDCVAQTSIIRKAYKSNARIYRRGVFVREINHKSVFDYNLNELTLDEARVANDYSTKYDAAKIVRTCGNVDVLTDLLINCTDKDWEWDFEYHNAYIYETEATREKNNALWQNVQSQILDSKTIFASKLQNVEQARGKGYQIREVSEKFLELCEHRGLRTVKTILTADERNGRIVDETCDPLAQQAVDEVWGDLEKLGRTRGEIKPPVRSYNEEISGGARSLGLWNDGTVYINKCLLGAGVSRELYAVALEEVAHHITKATDNSRDFQEFFIQTCVALLRG